MTYTQPLGTPLFAVERHAIAEAQSQANANGAPVAVLARDGWFATCEDPEVVDAIDAGAGRGWELVALVDPQDDDEPCLADGSPRFPSRKLTRQERLERLAERGIDTLEELRGER